MLADCPVSPQLEAPAADFRSERVRVTRAWFRVIVPLKQIEYRVYGHRIIIYPNPYSIYLRGTISVGRGLCLLITYFWWCSSHFWAPKVFHVVENLVAARSTGGFNYWVAAKELKSSDYD